MDAHTDHILIVDDDREIRELVSTYLTKNGLRVTVVPDGRHMRSFLDVNSVDLIVLDVMMPGDDGLVLCRELRAGKHKATPVLMLTARSDETDRIVGLEMGADDYLAKPFAARELLARIKAVLRRTRMLPPNLQITEAGQLLAFGDWQLDTTARHLIDQDGVIVALSGAEYRLLRVLSTIPSACLTATSCSASRRPRSGNVRTLDRPAGQPLAPAPQGRCARAPLHQDRAQRGLCLLAPVEIREARQ